jgi:DNA-directed RNA polymerase subunit RPC12/RpoP
LVRKGVAVWLLGSLTILAGLHALDGFFWLMGFESNSLLLTLYPFGRLLGPINPVLYFSCALAMVFALWGGTTIVALRNPLESFLGRVLEDGKKENQADVELLETRTSVLEMMSETLSNNSELLAGLRDVVFSVRGEVLSVRPLGKGLEQLCKDVRSLKKTMSRLEKEVRKQKQCPACGRRVLTEFRLCPYCGENLLKPRVNESAALLPPLTVVNGK